MTLRRLFPFPLSLPVLRRLRPHRSSRAMETESPVRAEQRVLTPTVASLHRRGQDPRTVLRREQRTTRVCGRRPREAPARALRCALGARSRRSRERGQRWYTKGVCCAAATAAAVFVAAVAEETAKARVWRSCAFLVAGSQRACSLPPPSLRTIWEHRHSPRLLRTLQQR